MSEVGSIVFGEQGDFREDLEWGLAIVKVDNGYKLTNLDIDPGSDTFTEFVREENDADELAAIERVL